MKRARRFFALLLTLAMVLTYMPATAFAEGEGSEEISAVSVEYKGGQLYFDSEVTDQDELYSSVYDSLYKEGNSFTVTFSDGSSKEYIYSRIQDGETEEDYYYGYCCNNDPDDTIWEEIVVDKNNNKVTLTVQGYYNADVYFDISTKVDALPYPVADKLEYSGDTSFHYDEEDGQPYLSGFWNPGNTITLTWKDGTVETFVSKDCKYYDNEDGEYFDTTEYFPADEEPSTELDEDGYPVNRIFGLGWEHAEGTTDTFIVSYEYRDGKTISAEVKGVAVASISYEGPALVYEKWGDEIYGAGPQEGAKIIVTYTDGSTKTAVCRKWGTNKTEDGDSYDEFGFFFEGVEPIIEYDEEEGYYYASNEEYFDYDWDNTTAEGVPVEYMGVKGVFPAKEKVYYKPVSVEFVPAAGFVPKACIGEVYLYTDIFYGKGNKFIVTYEDGSTDEYVYVVTDKETEEGDFFLNGDTDERNIYVQEKEFKKGLAKGKKTVSFNAIVWAEGYDDEFKLPFKETIDVSLYVTYADWKTYTYTGKTITPKSIKVYYVTESGAVKTVPSKAYTYKMPKGKKIGSYSFIVKFKPAYQNKYGRTAWAGYYIGPSKPTITKLTGGKKSLTVKWKKIKKNCDGYFVVYSTSKNFTKGVKFKKVSKSKTSLTVKKLKKGKTYYVQVYSYKKVKNKYGTEEIWSLASKTKKVKVK